jgi:hypothetical protein
VKAPGASVYRAGVITPKSMSMALFTCSGRISR